MTYEKPDYAAYRRAGMGRWSSLILVTPWWALGAAVIIIVWLIDQLVWGWSGGWW